MQPDFSGVILAGGGSWCSGTRPVFEQKAGAPPVTERGCRARVKEADSVCDEERTNRLIPQQMFFKHCGYTMFFAVQDSNGVHQRAVVLLSGGIDSFACAHFLLTRQFAVSGLFVDFGQPAAAPEAAAAKRVCDWLGIENSVIRIGSAQYGSFEAGEIPARNLALLASATLLTRGSRLIALGIHAGTDYFDCSPVFLEQANRLIAECTSGTVSVVAPFLHWTKQHVVTYAQSEQLDLGLSYSCERGTVPPCGTCLSCRDRKALNC